MYRYGNAVFTSSFHQKLKNKKQHYQFRVTNEFETNICVRIYFKKIECLPFCGDSNIEEGKKETKF